jgi:hypothetical protein
MVNSGIPESSFVEVRFNPHRSFFSLVAFCATSAVILALGLVLLFASFTLVLAVAHSLKEPDANPLGASVEAAAAATDAANSTIDSPDAIIFAGVITDAHCGPRHDMGSGRSPGECTRLCVRDGEKYLIVSGEKRYALEGETDALTPFAGERATITGVLTGDTIKINSISPEK